MELIVWIVIFILAGKYVKYMEGKQKSMELDCNNKPKSDFEKEYEQWYKEWQTKIPKNCK